MRDSKAYQQLLIARKKIIFFLLSITIIAYFAFISVIAFYPSFFGQLIGNSFFSMGIVLGFILILKEVLPKSPLLSFQHVAQ